MPPRSFRRWLLLLALLLAAVVVASCGGGSVPGTPGSVGRLRFASPTPVATVTPRAGATARPAATSPYTVIRTYTDGRGRTVTLFHGRAVGLRGDWGWSHIVGKHLKGEWRDGGPITTFGIIGVTTPEGVQEIIGRALKEDSQPDDVARGRREYRLPVPTTRFEVLTVVGNDGAIITAYPASPRGQR